jgi:hypothetical protein
MSNLLTEQLRLVTHASKDVPGRPHTSTLIRWCRRGVRGVKLETVVVGGRRYTSIEAIQRFIAKLSDPQPAQDAAAARDDEGNDVERALDEAGIR